MLRLTGSETSFICPFLSLATGDYFCVHKFKMTQHPKMVYEYEICIPLRFSGDRLIETPIPVPRGSLGKQEHIRLFRHEFFFV